MLPSFKVGHHYRIDGFPCVCFMTHKRPLTMGKWACFITPEETADKLVTQKKFRNRMCGGGQSYHVCGKNRKVRCFPICVGVEVEAYRKSKRAKIYKQLMSDYREGMVMPVCISLDRHEKAIELDWIPQK